MGGGDGHVLPYQTPLYAYTRSPLHLYQDMSPSAESVKSLEKALRRVGEHERNHVMITGHVARLTVN